MDIVLQGNRQPVHEGGPRCDGVAVKHIRLLFDRNRDALLCKLLSQPLLLLFLYQYTSIVIQLQSSCLVSSNSTQSSISMLQLICSTLCLLAACSCGTCICLLGNVSRQALHPAKTIFLPFPRHPVPPGNAWNAAGSSLREAQLHLQHGNTEA